MKIQFLKNENCRVHNSALLELKLALSELGIKENIQEIVIKTEEEATKFKFMGSPSVLIDGEDVDLSHEGNVYSVNTCRTYLYKGKFYEYPPREMIIHALELHI